MIKIFFVIYFLFVNSLFCDLQNTSSPLRIRQPIKNFIDQDLVICSFGASVTVQKKSIWDHFVLELNKKTGRAHQHIKIGYPGTNLYSASICYIDEVIRKNPDVCIIDWFDTSMTPVSDTTEKCLETLIRKLYEINSYIIFFYHTNTNYSEKIKRIDFINFSDQIACNYNVTSYHEDEAIQAYEGSIREAILRDTVHTTDYGSECLGRIFCDYFYQIPILEESSEWSAPILPPQNDFYHVYKVEITEKMIKGSFYVDDKNFFVFGKGSFLNLNLTGTLIGFDMKVGPFSPIINITIDMNKNIKYSVWDRWCYYERLSYKFPTFSSKNNIEISISHDCPAYQNSLKDFNFNGIEPLLKIKNFYFY